MTKRVNPEVNEVCKVSKNEVGSEIDTLNDTINDTINAFKELQKRLEPIVRKYPECDSNDENKLNSIIPLADDIRENRFRVESILFDINKTIEGLEL